MNARSAAPRGALSHFERRDRVEVAHAEERILFKGIENSRAAA